MTMRFTDKVLGIPVDVITWTEAVGRICDWAGRRESRYVSICDAHSIVKAGRDAEHGRHILSADMVTPDGWPVAWMLRQIGHAQQERINGPDLMGKVLAEAEKRKLCVYFYGTTDTTLALLHGQLMQKFPALKIVGMYSPPFRPLTAQEVAEDIERINKSGAHLVMTGLGCPKEDRWMYQHRGKVHAVMLGIGAGIDFWAGTVTRAPDWMRLNGLEWLYRLSREPQRLWKRYLVHNTLFAVGALSQLLGVKSRH
jgi:N-acetylglucosaminyldiphosphoundecaprenol N-acetyl-beta-D-mannosaminyltransferase